MNAEEYNMTFGQWCNATKGESLELDEYGGIFWKDKNKARCMDEYHALWMSEREGYRLKEKNEQITTALEALRAQGITCILSDYASGHIRAKNRYGVSMSYYATTGTITGYGGTPIKGLDEFIRLLKR